MIEERLRAGSVEDVSALIAGCQFPTGTLVLLESLPQVLVDEPARQNLLYFDFASFDNTPFDKTVDLASYTSGRIFHEDFELRWEQNAGRMQVIYLAKKSGPEIPTLQPVDKEVLDLDQVEARERFYFLFGERLRPEQLERIGKPPARDGDFAVLRIPRLLRYPAPPKAERVQLVVQELIHKDTGQLVLFRFKKLVSEEEKKEQL